MHPYFIQFVKWSISRQKNKNVFSEKFNGESALEKFSDFLSRTRQSKFGEPVFPDLPSLGICTEQECADLYKAIEKFRRSEEFVNLQIFFQLLQTTDGLKTIMDFLADPEFLKSLSVEPKQKKSEKPEISFSIDGTGPEEYIDYYSEDYKTRDNRDRDIFINRHLTNRLNISETVPSTDYSDYYADGLIKNRNFDPLKRSRSFNFTADSKADRLNFLKPRHSKPTLSFPEDEMYYEEIDDIDSKPITIHRELTIDLPEQKNIPNLQYTKTQQRSWRDMESPKHSIIPVDKNIETVTKYSRKNDDYYSFYYDWHFCFVLL